MLHRSKWYDLLEIFQVLSNPDGHEIQGKKIDPKLATPQAGHGRQEEKSTKVFVGGLDKAVSKDELTSIFAQRGNVSFNSYYFSFV